MPVRAAAAAAAADDATLLRVFLNDGTSLVSYGELARVGDRVVFSMPTAASPNPPLQLVNLPADRVDWDRTNRYAESARATHYIADAGRDDYAALSERGRAGAERGRARRPTRRSGWRSSSARARRSPTGRRSTYNYRQAEVRQMLSMLDEAIADLRAAAGAQPLRPDAVARSPIRRRSREPLLPPPTPQEAIEQMLLAARAGRTAPAERTSLLADGAGDDRSRRRRRCRPTGRRRPAPRREAAIATELQLDRSYQALTRADAGASPTARAQRRRPRPRAAAARHSAARRGARREAARRRQRAGRRGRGELDAARQLQLARDRWALRAPDLQRYRVAIAHADGSASRS